MAIRENYSRKRLAIIEALKDTNTHPTAEWIYTKLKTDYPDLSLGTVYRNIKKFCADNKVKSVGVVGGQERFDANIEPHSHFTCEKCNAIIDIDKTFLNADLLSTLSREYNISVLSHDVMFHGVCNHCRAE